MARFSFFGEGLQDVDLDELKGKLIVLEGTDRVGRSTHIRLLKDWLENSGHAVLDTGMTRSALAGKRLKLAKEGHTLGGMTVSLFHVTDFADRLENEIIPALRAGFIVLTDRYIYSLISGDCPWRRPRVVAGSLWLRFKAGCDFLFAHQYRRPGYQSTAKHRV